MNSKSKNIVLIIGFLVLIVLCYNFAISRTLKLKQELNALTIEEQHLKNAPKQLSLLKQKEKYYDSILGKYQINGSSIQNNLLKTITSFADTHNIKIVSFLEPHSIEKDNFSIKTYRFSIEGDYNSILNLIYFLEQKTRYGEIINLHFEKQKDFRKNTSYLQAHVLLKSFG